MPEIVERELEATLVPGAPPVVSPAEGEETPAQKPVGEAPAESKATEEQPAKQGKNRFERRLDRAYRREAEAKARGDLLERQLNELKAKLEPAASPDEPRLDQFDDIEKYATAKAAFREKKAIEKFQADQAQVRATQARAALQTTWEERQEKGIEKYPDFHDVVGDLTLNPLTAAIIKTPNAEDVAYALGKNLDEAERIAGLDLYEQILAIGQLSAKLTLNPPKAKTPSKAPEPIQPVSGSKPSTNVAEVVNNPKADDKAWILARQKQVRGGK